MTEALLILVHGSPRPEANADIFAVADLLRARGAYPIVRVGFMECNAPSIPDAVDLCIADGADSIVAVPYFLHTGTHVADDLPALLEDAQTRHPHVRFAMGRYLGASPILPDILADRARAA